MHVCHRQQVTGLHMHCAALPCVICIVCTSHIMQNPLGECQGHELVTSTPCILLVMLDAICYSPQHVRCCKGSVSLPVPLTPSHVSSPSSPAFPPLHTPPFFSLHLSHPPLPSPLTSAVPLAPRPPPFPLYLPSPNMSRMHAGVCMGIISALTVHRYKHSSEDRFRASAQAAGIWALCGLFLGKFW